MQQTIRFGAQEGGRPQAHGGAVDGQEEEGIHDAGEKEEVEGKQNICKKVGSENFMVGRG